MEGAAAAEVLGLHHAARHETFAPTGAGATTLSPAWKMLLFGDGSPTRLLSLLAGAPLAVSVLGMEALAGGGSGGGGSGGGSGGSGAGAGGAAAAEEAALGALWAPLAGAAAALAPPRVLRRVWLEAPAGQRVGYACSWWSAGDAAACLPDGSVPIGGALAAQRREIHRELLGVAHAVGHAGLEGGLGLPARSGSGAGLEGSSSCVAAAAAPGGDWGPRELWGRWYVMRQGGAPLCVIYEVFSPALERLLGARHQAAS
jgi:chorismate--pyruvate lyase